MILLKIFLISYFLFLISYFLFLQIIQVVLPVRIVSVSELKESTFVIPRAHLVMDVFLFCATITTVSCSDDDSIQEC